MPQDHTSNHLTSGLLAGQREPAPGHHRPDSEPLRVAPESLPQPIRAVAVALFDLIRVEYAVADAYDAAVDREECAAYAGPLRKFMTQHDRHVDALIAHLERLGATPPIGSDSRRMVARGEIAVASMAGPTGILHAVVDKENKVIRVYTRAITRPHWPDPLLDLLEHGMATARARRDWLHAQR